MSRTLVPALAAAAGIVLVVSPALAEETVRRRVDVRRVAPQPGTESQGTEQTPLVVRHGQAPGELDTTFVNVGDAPPVQLETLPLGVTISIPLGDGNLGRLRRTESGFELDTGSKVIVIPLREGTLVLDPTVEDYGLVEVPDYEADKLGMYSGRVPRVVAEERAALLLAAVESDASPAEVHELVSQDAMELIAPYLGKASVEWIADFRDLDALASADPEVAARVLELLGKQFDAERVAPSRKAPGIEITPSRR